MSQYCTTVRKFHLKEERYTRKGGTVVKSQEDLIQSRLHLPPHSFICQTARLLPCRNVMVTRLCVTLCLPGFLGLDLSAKVREESQSEFGDLETVIEHVQKEAVSRSSLPVVHDMKVDEVWKTLMMWYGTHEDSINQSRSKSWDMDSIMWCIEGFLPVLHPRNTTFSTDDVYLILNRVDDREG